LVWKTDLEFTIELIDNSNNDHRHRIKLLQRRHMQKIWNYISSLGTTGKNSTLNQRAIVLTNQLNFVMLMAMVILLITTIGALKLTADTIYLGTLRVAVLLAVAFLNLIAARYGFTQISRLSLIYLPPVVFLLGPTLVGYVEEESYTYYPYVLICASIIPQLLVNPKREKFLFWLSLLYYFVLTLIIDMLMIRFGKGVFPIVGRIKTFYAFYKIAHIGLFMFLNACIYYLRMLNFRFEEELNRKISELDNQNTELKNQKEKIEKQKDELIKKEVSTWQKLLSIISHEIVNSTIPITNLAGMTGQMLEDESGTVLKPEKISEETTEDIHHSLKIIESRTKALINFVKNTKSLTQIPQPNIRQIEIRELFDRIALLYQAKFTAAGVHFKREIGQPDLCINADLELVEQVIINLIQNALEAMQEIPDPKLSISAIKNSSGQVQISITDNGPGIKPELLEKVFFPFFTTKVTSSGIGLSLSQQILQLHDARLEVVSTPGHGATFMIVF
jgi:signal transduction histidine kinase